MDVHHKDIADIEHYADEEDRLMDGKAKKKHASANRSDRVHMDSQNNNKEKQAEANIKKTAAEKAVT